MLPFVRPFMAEQLQSCHSRVRTATTVTVTIITEAVRPAMAVTIVTETVTLTLINHQLISYMLTLGQIR